MKAFWNHFPPQLWIAAVALALLAVVAHHFSRQTYRWTAVVLVMVGAAAVTWYGAGHQRGAKDKDVVAAFGSGHKALADEVFGRHFSDVDLGPVGWSVLLLLLLFFLVFLDYRAARREQPRVEVVDVPTPADGKGGANDGNAQLQRELSAELKFRLPAVEVRKPASMPGGVSFESIASIVSSTEISGSKVIASLMNLVHKLEAKPPTYEVRMYTEKCDPEGQPQQYGERWHVTVELREARTGQNLMTRILRPALPNEAAELVAAVTAWHVFRCDPSTPNWAVGAETGDDLTAYLLSQEMAPRDRTYPALYNDRTARRERLEKVVGNSPDAGVVRYELASMYDMAGDNLRPVLLHLVNRVHHPGFLRGRYGLALSLNMLAGETFTEQWLGKEKGKYLTDDEKRKLAMVRHDIARQLWRAEMLGGLGNPKKVKEALENDDPDDEEVRTIRRAFLYLAWREFYDYQRAMRPHRLLWNALVHRQERALYLEILRSGRYWRHPRRMTLSASAQVCRKLTEQHLRRLDDPHDSATLPQAQQEVLRQLGLDKVIYDHGGWTGGKAPWQAIYNAACLFALPTYTGKCTSVAVKTIVALLRLAIADPKCELRCPSEWIAMDPDLRYLRRWPEFCEFVEEQAERDFEQPKTDAVNEIAKTAKDRWFMDRVLTNVR